MKQNINQSGMKNRVEELVQYLKFSDSMFAKEIKVDPGNFNKKVNGIQKWTIYDVKKICERFSVSREWLLDGTGGMFNETYRPVTKMLPSDFEEKPEEKPQYSIPLIPTEAMAGFLSVDSVSIRESDIEDYYSIPAFRKSDFCIRVKGDSMEPKYVSGDIIACTRVPLSGLWFQWGKVYVIDTRQGALVKHIERGSDDNHIMLVSDNQRYKPFEIPTSEIFGVAIVDGLIRIRTE